MTKIIIPIALAILIALGASWYLAKDKASLRDTTENDLASYRYLCDDGSEFSMNPAPGVAAIRLTPGVGGNFEGTTLLPIDDSRTQFEGGGLLFVGAGEGVTLTQGSTVLECNPVLNQDMAPFNWGDAAEGGGVAVDLPTLVSKSIIGTWKSKEDSTFTREFKEDGTVIDRYDNGSVSNGTWVTFTENDSVTSDTPLDSDAVYVELVMDENPGLNLLYKFTKMTPELLELSFNNGATILTFTRVK